MRKNFLLVFLLGLLPLAGWAVAPTAANTPTLVGGTLTYTSGTEHTLVGTAVELPAGYDKTYGKVLYIALKDEDASPLTSRTGWSEELPKATDAGRYYVYYYITNDGTTQYNVDGAVTRIGTYKDINKRAITIGTEIANPAPITGLAFTNADQTLFEAPEWIGPDGVLGTIEYRVQQGTLTNATNYGSYGDYGAEIPKGFNATGYRVQYRVNVTNPNYTWNYTNASTQNRSTNTIARATWVEGENYTAPVSADNVFNNTNQNLLVAGTNTLGATIQYANSNNILTTWRNQFDHNDIKATTAGNYTRYYRIQGGNGYNWNALNAASVTGTILKADVTWNDDGALATSPLIYNNQNQQLVTTAYTASLTYGGGGAANVRYWIEQDGVMGTNYITNIANVVGKEVGTYKIYYTINCTGNAATNYNNITEPQLIGEVVIGKAVLVAAAQEYTKDYTETEWDDPKVFFTATGWQGTDVSDATAQQNKLNELLVVNGYAQTDVGTYDVTVAPVDPQPADADYEISPLLVQKTKLEIKKVDNDWVNKVAVFPASWGFATVEKADLETYFSAEPKFKNAKNGAEPVKAKITYKFYKDVDCTEEFELDQDTPVGTYYVKAFVEETDNFYALETATADAAVFEIVQVDNAWKDGGVKIEGWEYSKGPNAPVAETEDAAEITYEYFYEDGVTPVVEPIDAFLPVGKYYVKATAAATVNHLEIWSQAGFEVTPTELPEIAFTYDAVPYIEEGEDGHNQIPEVADVQAKITEVTTADYDVTFTDAEGNATTEFVNAGTYYVVITGKGNYAKEVGDPLAVNFQQKAFVIEPIDPIISDPVRNLLTYNNTDQELVVPAEFNKGVVMGTIEYSLDGENWSEKVPTGLNAGKYTVQTRYTADGNHNDRAFEPVEVEILPVQLTYMLSNLEKTWTGLECSPEEVEKTYSIFGLEGLQGDDAYYPPFTLALPVTEKDNFIDAKEYNFKQMTINWTDEWKDAEVKNYKINFSGTGTVLINKADIEDSDFDAPSAIDELVYTGTEQELVTAGEVLTKYKDEPIGTIWYYQGETAPAEDAADWTQEIPAATEAGDYPVWYMVKGDSNHNNKVAEKALAGKIAAFDLKDVEISEIENKTYNAKDQKSDILGELTLTYKVDAETTLTLVEGTDFTIEAADEMKDADTYTIKFTAVEDGNYTGSNEISVTIDPFEVIAEALPTSKVYNGLEGKELRDGETYANGLTEIVVKYGGLFEGEEDAISAEDAITIDKASKNIGDYEIVLEKDKFVSKNYVIKEVTGAIFSITAAPLTIGWNYAAPGFSKVYGEDDPALIATTADLVITGAGDGDADLIAENIVITRAEGDAVGEYDITLSAKKDIYGNVVAVFKNYTFDTPFCIGEKVFSITAAGVKVSIAPQVVTYTGEKAIIEVTADKLVITGLENEDDKAKVFEGGELPAITIPDDAINVGEYKVTLSGGKSLNYTIEYLPSYITVEPAPVTVKFAAQQIQVGQDVEENIDADAFTVTGLVAEADRAIFSIDVNEDYQDFDGKISAAAGTYADGLVIVTSDAAQAANYSGWEEAAGELLIIAAETIVLDDSAPVVTTAAEGATVTFESRSINVGNWNVMVLPFDASVAQISNAFGYAAVDILNPEADSKGNVHFMITTSGVIEAGTPFIVKTTDDEGLKKSNFNEVTFTGVDIKKFDGENTSVSDNVGNQFIGTFQETKIWGQNSRYMSGGAWYDARNFTESKPVTIKPLRAYVVTVNPKARIFIEEPDGTVTAIDAVNFNNAINGEAIYNLNGVKVNNINRKGVFIQNGKKVVK